MLANQIKRKYIYTKFSKRFCCYRVSMTDVRENLLNEVFRPAVGIGASTSRVFFIHRQDLRNAIDRCRTRKHNVPDSKFPHHLHTYIPVDSLSFWVEHVSPMHWQWSRFRLAQVKESKAGFPLFYWQKFLLPTKVQDFSKTPWKKFPDVRSPRMFKYKEKMAFTYNIQRVVHCKIHQHSTPYLSKQWLTQTGRYTVAACFPFEPLEKCTTFTDIFQDFPGPKL